MAKCVARTAAVGALTSLTELGDGRPECSPCSPNSAGKAPAVEVMPGGCLAGGRLALTSHRCAEVKTGSDDGGLVLDSHRRVA